LLRISHHESPLSVDQPNVRVCHVRSPPFT
jgi:hypothetical protein